MEHGSRNGYEAHRRMGEVACEECRHARSAYQMAWEKKSGYRRKPQIRSEEYKRRKRWRRKGIDPYAAQAALESHDGRCEICGTEDPGPTTWHIDHQSDLEPNAPVRGVLCHLCNVGLGFFREDTAAMRAAIAYLEQRHA